MAKPDRAALQQAQELETRRHRCAKARETHRGFVAIAVVKLWIAFVYGR
jgi:hypothetical protein